MWFHLKMINDLYQPLESARHIRLLKLLPGEPDASISTELEHLSLDDAQHTYEAVSYTWGTEDASQSISCNSQPFLLRPNALDFLRRLRQTDKCCCIWMDCICINQNDIREREDQVKIMHLIYAQARSVCVWLGLAGSDSSVALGYAAQLDAKKHLTDFLRHTFDGRSRYAFRNKTFMFDDFPETESNKRLFDAIKALIRRTWLKRVWVQQEAALCAVTRVLCGPDEITWDHFFSLTWILTKRKSMECPDWIYEPLRSIEPALDAIRSIQARRATHLRMKNPFELERFGKSPLSVHELYATHEEQLILDKAQRSGPTNHTASSFAEIARIGSGCEATDPRDKVYALFNLATDDVFRGDRAAHKIEIDYHASWQTVYTRVAERMYGNVQTTLARSVVIELSGRCMQVGNEMPSWAPDWRRGLDLLFVPHSGWFAGGSAYPASIKFMPISKQGLGKGFNPPYRNAIKGGRSKPIGSNGMEVTALLLDKVVYRSPQVQLDAEYLRDDAEQLQAKLQSDLTYIGKFISKYFTGESGLDAYAGTLIANTDHDDNLATAEYERTGFAEFFNWLMAGCPSPAPRLQYYDALQNSEVFWKNAFCITAHGLMCVSSKMVQDGDFIAILQGIRFPVALRKVGPADGQHFELLGISYVHRMMRGRVWSLIDEFKCKYVPGSELETVDSGSLGGSEEYVNDGPCESFPFNPKSDYRSVMRVLGKRKIVLV